MKIVLLIAGSRAGADFFHSLIDEHNEIFQFPGYLNINENFYEIFSLKNSNKIAKSFIDQYPNFFNSKKNIIERHNKLGKNKNRFFRVNKKKFTDNFYLLMKKKKYTKFNILFSLHAAYELAKGKNIKKKKIIFINTHIIDYTNKFISFVDYKNIELIHTIRHPMSALSSPIKNWTKYKKGKFFFGNSLYFHFDLVYFGINKLLKLKKKLFIIQLEKLHNENKKVMKDFCRIFKIKFQNCLKKSTYHNLSWWGDEVSNKYINGINKNFKINYEKKFFFERDVIFLEFLAKDIMRHYEYDSLLKSKEKYFFNFFPMKCELIVWKNTVINGKLIPILLLPYFYFKRLMFINKFSLIKNKLPYSIGTK